jgi:hypothetical protein
MNKQRLGWIGASIAAGIFPTFQMTFAPETLAGPEHPESDQASGHTVDAPPAWSGQPTHFTSRESALPNAG